MIDWPDHDSLDEMVFFLGYQEVGRRLGVSDNAIRKHMKRDPCTPECSGTRLRAGFTRRKRCPRKRWAPCPRRRPTPW